MMTVPAEAATSRHSQSQTPQPATSKRPRSHPVVAQAPPLLLRAELIPQPRLATAAPFRMTRP